VEKATEKREKRDILKILRLPLGILLTELGNHLGIPVPGVGYAGEGDNAIRKDNNYQLVG